MTVENKCCIDGCENPPRYVIEWYGLNQHRENPEVVGEATVCKQFEHLVTASYHDRFGGVPDGIVNYHNLDEENPSLFERVKSSMD